MRRGLTVARSEMVLPRCMSPEMCGFLDAGDVKLRGLLFSLGDGKRLLACAHVSFLRKPASQDGGGSFFSWSHIPSGSTRSPLQLFSFHSFHLDAEMVAMAICSPRFAPAPSPYSSSLASSIGSPPRSRKSANSRYCGRYRPFPEHVPADLFQVEISDRTNVTFEFCASVVKSLIS